MGAPLKTDRVVIVGAGLAALYAALELAPHPVLVISPEVLGQGASSAWAQGGVAAAMAAADTPEAHARDTVLAGAGTVDARVAQMVTEVARRHILDLTDLGTPFDRNARGEYLLNREAAHSAARVVRVKGDQAGRQIMETLIRAVQQAPSVQVLEGVQATALASNKGRVTGVWINRAAPESSASVLIETPAVLLAGGGSAGLFAHTTNPPRIRGQVIGMAALAGATIADAEFVQFHPTAIDTGEDPLPLATEALRGEGAILVNRHGARFMQPVHPDAELAPRDVVAREIFAQTMAGNRPALDTRAALGPRVTGTFPAVAEACARAGIDPVKDPIPVVAAAHYHMGGIATDARGRADLTGLWVCGEAASTGLHGANRLASNGLLEALVFARNAARDMASALPEKARAGLVDPVFAGTGSRPDPDMVARLRRLMSTYVGVQRSEDGLRRALAEIDWIETQHPDCPLFRAMTATATLIAASALQRRESRGGHFRIDYPAPNPALAYRSRMTLTEALALRRHIAKEAQAHDPIA